jgi:ABC-type multidrug transport system ATPase subunit
MKIDIHELSKIYKNGNRAVSDINLDIESGMLGLLGPNGAGKTTLMRILATLMKPTSGTVTVNGLDLQKHRKEIRAMLGFLPQEFGYFAKLRTWEFLDYSARLAGLKSKLERNEAVDEMLTSVGLFEFRDRMAKKLSGGMKRRLGIAQALIGNPRIIIVDEPTTGLDPEERIRFRNLLSDMSREEIIIILSTHIVGDISSTCRKMALLNKGELTFQGPPDELVNMAKGHVFRIEAFDSDLETIKEKYPVISTIPSENGWEVEVVADTLKDYSGREIDPNLEHAYIYYMEYVLQETVVNTLA